MSRPHELAVSFRCDFWIMIHRPGGAGILKEDAFARAEGTSCFMEMFCPLQAVIQNGFLRRGRVTHQIGPLSESEGEHRGDGLGNLKG